MPVYFPAIPKNQVFRSIFRAGVSVNHLSINHTEDEEAVYSYAHHPDNGSPYTSTRTVDMIGITNVEVKAILKVVTIKNRDKSLILTLGNEKDEIQ